MSEQELIQSLRIRCDRMEQSRNEYEERCRNLEAANIDKVAKLAETQTELDHALIQCAKCDERIDALVATFTHTHDALYIDGRLIDQCGECGLDLRDTIHKRTS